MAATRLTIATARGDAGVVMDRPGRSITTVGLLVLGHGAAGDVNAVDLVAIRDAAVRVGFVVARVTQPYRMGGRRPPPATAILDEAWTAAVTAIQAKARARVPLVVGGRSSGARVACRTGRDLGAVGVLALAFPLHPPGRPEKSRAAELDPNVPTLVLNGDRDPFGVPTGGDGVRVIVRPGEGHDLGKDPQTTAEIAVAWLVEIVGDTPGTRDR